MSDSKIHTWIAVSAETTDVGFHQKDGLGRVVI